MSIVEFLEARIAEDETCGHCKHPVKSHVGQWCRVPTGAIKASGAERICCCEGASADSRILAECQAKRAIIERETSQRTYEPGALPNVETTYRHDGRLIVHTPDGGELLEGPEVDEWLKRYTEPVTDTPTLRILASVYAEHPTYDPAWR